MSKAKEKTGYKYQEKAAQPATYAATESQRPKGFSAPELPWVPTAAYSQMAQGIANAVKIGVPKGSIIQAYKQAIQEKDYEEKLAGIHKKQSEQLRIAGSSTEILKQTNELLYTILGVPKPAPAKPQTSGITIPNQYSTWSEKAVFLYGEVAKRTTWKGAGEDRIPDLLPGFREVARGVQKDLFPAFTVEEVQASIVDHVLRGSGHHAREIKDLDIKTAARALKNEYELHLGLQHRGGSKKKGAAPSEN